MGLRADSARPQRVSGSARTDSRRAESARNPIASHVNFGDDSGLSVFTRTQWTAALRVINDDEQCSGRLCWVRPDLDLTVSVITNIYAVGCTKILACRVHLIWLSAYKCLFSARKGCRTERVPKHLFSNCLGLLKSNASFFVTQKNKYSEIKPKQ